MTTNKLTRVKRLSATVAFPATFAARVARIPDSIGNRCTAAEIAAIIDGPMRDSHSAGYWSGRAEA